MISLGMFQKRPFALYNLGGEFKRRKPLLLPFFFNCKARLKHALDKVRGHVTGWWGDLREGRPSLALPFSLVLLHNNLCAIPIDGNLGRVGEARTGGRGAI